MNEQQTDRQTHNTWINKIRSSLVLKLNLNLLGVLLSTFGAINFLIVIIITGTAFYKIEQGTQLMTEIISRAEEDTQSTRYYTTNYKAIPLEYPGQGYVFPGILQYLLPLEFPNAARSIDIPGRDLQINLPEQIEQITYHTYLDINDQPYQITYQIGEDILRLIIILAVLFAIELLLLLRSLVKGSTSFRRTLKPISEMAETAKTLNAQVGSDGIQNLTGAISRIDANQLDNRISVDDSQKELKDLAVSINLMLNRISASYQSQVRFVSDASHELRTPISVIQGYVNLLDRWGKNDQKALQESIDAIKSETENMKLLVEQLLFLARGDNDTMQLHIEAFDVGSMVEEIVRDAQLIDVTHRFQTEFADSIMLEADRQLLKQAIRILVENSIKYTPANEAIILKVYQADGQVKITVQDNGIGIPAEDLPHIFDRFYRSDESRARKTGGSGLGLAIAKWIIERHNGHFEVLSRVDIGTRTTIILPASPVYPGSTVAAE